MALTVQSLLDSLDVKVGGYKDSLPTATANADKIRLLNAAKNKVWQHLVAAGRMTGGNWFVKKSTLALGAGLNDVDLPADFHDMASVQGATAGWEAVRFVPSDFWKDVYREQRQTAGNAAAADGTRYYLISGDVPAVFNLDRPTAGISLTIFYTSLLPEYSAAGDNIDRMTTVYQDAIVNCAAMMNAMSRQDVAIANLFKAMWDEDKALIAGVASSRRSLAGVVKEMPYDNIG